VAHPRMHVGAAPAATRQPLQQREQGCPIVVTESGEQFRLLLIGELVCPRQKLPRGRREPDRMGPPVIGVAASLDKPALLELIDQADHHVAVNTEGIRQLLLGLPVFVGQVHKQAEMVGLDTQWRQTVGKAPRALGAQYGKQVTHSGIERKRGRSARLISHSSYGTH
jgi:hypothetical protein